MDRRRDNQIMTKIEFKKASGPLSEYAEKARKDPVIVIKRGKPFAAVIPIRNADEENCSAQYEPQIRKYYRAFQNPRKKRGRHIGNRTAPAVRSGEINFHSFDIPETRKLEVQL